jgi:hypothetical protein
MATNFPYFKVRTNVPEEFSITWIVASGAATTITAGDPTLLADATASATGAVKIAADGDPTNASGHRFAGFAKNASTDTAAAAGVVTTILPIGGMIYSGLALLSTTANTAAKVNALMGKRVILDLTATVWSVDAAATDATTNGCVIVGGDFRTTEIWFMVAPHVTLFTGAN